MEQSKALEFIEKNKINIDAYSSVIVTSDNAVYLNSELEAIAAHCKDTNKTYYVVKSDVKEPVKEVKKSEEAPKAEDKKAAPKKQGKK